MIKIGICIPFRSKVSLSWALTLSEFLRMTTYPSDVFISKHYRIDVARNELVLSAKEKDCTHILFIDTDIHPHLYVNGKYYHFPTFINHLVELSEETDIPIISGLYCTKLGFLGVFRHVEGKELPFEPIKPKLEDLEGKITFVDGIPMGLVLIKMSVFNELKERKVFPWFEYKVDHETLKTISEDLDFCFKVIRTLGKEKIAVWGHLVGLHESSTLLYPDGNFIYHSLGEY